VRELRSRGVPSKRQKLRTKQIADAIGESHFTTYKALRELEKRGLVTRRPLSPRPFLVRRTKTTSSGYKGSQYRNDASYVSSLARRNPRASRILRRVVLSKLDMQNKHERETYNDIVRALKQAGINGKLATYDLVSGSVYWWLNDSKVESSVLDLVRTTPSNSLNSRWQVAFLNALEMSQSPKTIREFMNNPVPSRPVLIFRQTHQGWELVHKNSVLDLIRFPAKVEELQVVAQPWLIEYRPLKTKFRDLGLHPDAQTVSFVSVLRLTQKTRFRDENECIQSLTQIIELLSYSDLAESLRDIWQLKK